MSLESFAKRIRVRADRLPGAVDKIVKQVAVSVDQAVVTATPVDTGRARSNWLASIDVARTGTVPTHGPGAEAASIAAARAVIASRKPGQAIFISNNLPYIERLNQGSSSQAPAMFVEAAVNEGVAVVKNAKLEI